MTNFSHQPKIVCVNVYSRLWGYEIYCSTDFLCSFPSGHPFIMFYTERVFSLDFIKSKPRKGSAIPSPQLDSTSLPELDKRRPHSCSLSENSSLTVTTKQPATSDTDKQDDCGLMDVLVVAISQVRISEPKRSRLCFSSGSSIQSQFSTNSLCKAF